MSVIEIQNISKIFGYADATTVALDDVDLRVEEGEFVIIMGPSGSGKTTLMNIIGLLDQATHGSYMLNGESVALLSERARAKIRRDQIGFIFQSPSLLPRLNVIDNVALPLTYKGFMQGKRRQLAYDLLEKFGVAERSYYRSHQLSGGQAQRAAIARALVNNPSIVLADEPTGNLDSKSTEVIMQALRDINAEGNTIVMVTHNPNLTKYADRVITMLDGSIQTDDVDITTIELPSEVTSDKLASKRRKSISRRGKPIPKKRRKK